MNLAAWISRWSTAEPTVGQEEVRPGYACDKETKIALADEMHWGNIRDVELWIVGSPRPRAQRRRRADA
jgi:hypothetical protein